MVRQADDGAAAYLEVVRRDADAAAAQRLGLVIKMLQIDDDAVADDVDRGLAEDAGGEEIEDELALLVDDRVTGVVAALITADDVIILREQIDHAALALIAPVCSHDCS